jgi:hypothetical protein
MQRTPNMSTEQEPSALACSACGRTIDCYAFCDEETCEVACCYRCLWVELGVSLAQPHQHGG